MLDSEIVIFKKKLKMLEVFKGRGTELISVYIPPETDRGSVMGQLSDEMSQSSNIKSPQTRKNVQGALKRISNFLKQINFKIPETGLVVFSGNVSDKEGISDIRLFTVRPPNKLKTKLYWCDSEFHLAPLKEMATPSDTYALIAMDKREATIALLIGKKYEIMAHYTSAVPGKTMAGGQCLAPETLIQLSNGEIIEIRKAHNPLIVSSADFQNMKITQSSITQKWETTKQTIVNLKTDRPKYQISCSLDHTFFVLKNDKVKEKTAAQLVTGDTLLGVEQKKIIPIKLKSKEITNKKQKMIDISVKNQNFIANGLLVHNSAHRFERLREEAAQDFYKRISEKVNQLLIDVKNLKGIIVGGPGGTKFHFLEKDMIDYRLKPKILGTVDITYTDESGIREIMQRSGDLLKESEAMQEKQLVQEFFTQVAKNALGVFGEKETLEALTYGKVKILLISEAIDWEVIKTKCTHCGKEAEIIVKNPLNFNSNNLKCSECASPVEIIEEIDYLDYLLEKVQNISAEMKVISRDTEEGNQFYQGFSGIGAILRFK